MSTYAASTSVPSDRSRVEIEKTLSRYGASQFMYGWDATRAIVGFVMHDRQVRFVLPMPERTDTVFTRTPTGRDRTKAQAAYEQAVRSRWRALALVVKAKLEAVETGIVGFEQEFLAHLVLPNGQTVGDWAEPQIAEVYATGHMPALMPGTVPTSGPKAIGGKS